MPELSELNKGERLTARLFEVRIPPEKREFDPKTFTYILNVTEPLKTALEGAGIVLPDTLKARS